VTRNIALGERGDLLDIMIENMETKYETYTFEIFWSVLILIIFTLSLQMKTLFKKKEENPCENIHPPSFIFEYLISVSVC
jgi:hypothetical protein